MSALDGTRVIDLTRVIAGPLAGQILADLGADVIKIERPIAGDDVRHLGPPWMKDINGNELKESTYYSAVNRGKRSITLDFSKAEGLKLLKRLIADADILLENFRPGVLAKYGLDYDAISRDNKKIIYCSVSGFGHSGPYMERPGYDFLIQGMAGVMSVTGKPGAGPTRAGIPIADYSAGLTAVIGVLSALNHRNVSGKGQMVDVALFDCQVSMMLNVFSAWFNAKKSIAQSNDHPSACPHGVFPTKDGNIIIATMNDAQFTRIAKILGKPEWANDVRFAKNGGRVEHQTELIGKMSQIMREQPSEYWLNVLAHANIPSGPINKIEDLEKDSQLLAREMIVEFNDSEKGSIKTAGNPIKLSDTPIQYTLPPPRLGAHTESVLAEILNLSAAEIAALRVKSVI